MGLGEFGGNGSVVWTVVHEDSVGNPKNLIPVPSPADPGDDEVAVVPPSPVGGGPPRDARGKDPRPVADIGGLKGHAGKFRVKLRYGSQAEAAAAKSSAVIRNIGPNWFLEVDVPAKDRTNRHVDSPLEVRVDW